MKRWFYILFIPPPRYGRSEEVDAAEPAVGAVAADEVAFTVSYAATGIAFASV